MRQPPCAQFTLREAADRLQLARFELWCAQLPGRTPTLDARERASEAARATRQALDAAFR